MQAERRGKLDSSRHISIEKFLLTMAIGQIESVVGNFVAQGANEVLVLKGNWGIGKTHFWHRLIKKQSAEAEDVDAKEGFWSRWMYDKNQEVKIGKEKYSHISLFGINALDSVKRSIFTSAVEASNAYDRGFPDNFRTLAEIADDVPKLAEWGGSAVLEKAMFDRVQDALVCIDDLERRGEDMKIKDVLGLASMLKEERRCQVVLILNDGALDEEAQSEFEQYGEKLIDIEVEFERTPEGAFRCVFDE